MNCRMYVIERLEIPVGKENARHLDEIASKAQTSTSTAKRIIKNARIGGVPIISGLHGYWISESEEELEKFKRTMQKQAKSRLFTSSKVKINGFPLER